MIDERADETHCIVAITTIGIGSDMILRLTGRTGCIDIIVAGFAR